MNRNRLRAGRGLGAAVAALGLVGVAGASAPAHPTTPTEARTTVQQRLVGDDPSRGFSFLRAGPGEPYVVRDELAAARPGRAHRRRSLVYLAQITDLQLSDEESPVRVESVFDPLVPPLAEFGGEVSGGDDDPAEPAPEDEATVREDGADSGASAWRPQEALVAHQVELSIRQVNRFLRSPVKQANGRGARMLNAVLTGDLADNQQRNETQWVVQLLEGGTVQPNGGSADPAAYDAFCRSLVAAGRLDPAEAPRYTGVQDYDDYAESPHFYDPDTPAGIYAERGWPAYPGLMDRAQLPFVAEGLKVPSYVAFGNHDALVQGNEDANAAYERLATGCLKPSAAPVPNPFRMSDVLDPDHLRRLAESDPDKVMVVPPDPERRFVDKAQFRALHDTGAQDDAHGFGHIDPKELAASDGAASYYAFSPRDGLRYIVLDTVTQGGSFVYSPDPESRGSTPSVSTDDGNIDDPQFRWLQRELAAATRRDELTIVFAHHAAGTMFFNLPDEHGGVPPCTAADEHRHDANPGCDRDPRSSSPLHFGDELVDLLHRHPNVVAYVAGHSHENRIRAFRRPGGGGYWEVRSPAVADWPPQHRLIEVMDNRDGTLSIFGTLLDHAAPAEAPPSDTPAAGMDLHALGAIGRTLSYNDPQVGPGMQGGSPVPGHEGAPADRNVELLIEDPREGASSRAFRCGRRPATRIGTPEADRLRGSRRRDVVLGRPGNDAIAGRRGRDAACGGRDDDALRGGRGGDRLSGGPGRDHLRGGAGADRLAGGPGRDELDGGAGPDRIDARDGARDGVRCGRGRRDLARVDRADVVRGCERIRRGR